jgi:signal transduction histidine kinase
MAGLKKMIYELGYQTEQIGSLKVDIQFYDFPDQLPVEVSAQLYRIVQEAINNVQKHADAQNIDMQFFGYPEELIITIDDDGKGISATSKDGIGIQNMKARAEGLNGSFEISSKANKGTSLLFRIPLHPL